MADFSTGARLEVEVDQSTLRDARDEIEAELDGVGVGVAPDGGGTGAGGRIADTVGDNTDELVSLAQDRNELLEDILDELEEGGGGGILPRLPGFGGGGRRRSNFNPRRILDHLPTISPDIDDVRDTDPDSDPSSDPDPDRDPFDDLFPDEVPFFPGVGDPGQSGRGRPEINPGGTPSGTPTGITIPDDRVNFDGTVDNPRTRQTVDPRVNAGEASDIAGTARATAGGAAAGGISGAVFGFLRSQLSSLGGGSPAGSGGGFPAPINPNSAEFFEDVLGIRTDPSGGRPQATSRQRQTITTQQSEPALRPPAQQQALDAIPFTGNTGAQSGQSQTQVDVRVEDARDTQGMIDEVVREVERTLTQDISSQFNVL